MKHYTILEINEESASSLSDFLNSNPKEKILFHIDCPGGYSSVLQQIRSMILLHEGERAWHILAGYSNGARLILNILEETSDPILLGRESMMMFHLEGVSMKYSGKNKARTAESMFWLEWLEKNDVENRIFPNELTDIIGKESRERYLRGENVFIGKEKIKKIVNYYDGTGKRIREYNDFSW